MFLIAKRRAAGVHQASEIASISCGKFRQRLRGGIQSAQISQPTKISLLLRAKTFKSGRTQESGSRETYKRNCRTRMPLRLAKFKTDIKSAPTAARTASAITAAGFMSACRTMAAASRTGIAGMGMPICSVKHPAGKGSARNRSESEIQDCGSFRCLYYAKNGYEARIRNAI